MNMFRIAAMHVIAVASTALVTGLLALVLSSSPLFALNAAYWSFAVLMTVTTPGLVVPIACRSLFVRAREGGAPRLFVLLYGIGTVSSVAGAAAALGLDGRGLLVFLLPAIQTLFAALADARLDQGLGSTRLKMTDEFVERSTPLPVTAFAR